MKSKLAALFATALSVFCLFSKPTSAHAEVRIEVSVANQTADVYVDDVITYQWLVSTGRAKYATPLGTYPVRSLQERKRSKKFHAPMPNSVVFILSDSQFYAIHGVGRREERRLGFPASHGCVRLSIENSKALFDLVKHEGKENATVIIKE